MQSRAGVVNGARVQGQSTFLPGLRRGGRGEAARDRQRAEPSPARDKGEPNVAGDGVWEQVFERNNLFLALKRVEGNGGAPGIDGMPVQKMRPWLKAHWLAVRAALDNGSYKPSPVRRVEIPKPDGGVRLLGIPTVIDRLIQQALAQALTPLFEPRFSDHSYGFRPGRSAHDAIRVAQQYIADGYDWVVDIDLEKFFDRVNHDKLMARVARVVKDRRVLKLIRAYLASGVMVNGVVMALKKGRRKVARYHHYWRTSCWTIWIRNWNGGGCGSCATPTTVTSTWQASEPPSG